MPKLSQHSSSSFVKLIYIGDSSTGKTGSLESLVAAGYKIRMLDFDNGIETLKNYVKQQCPDKIDNVDYETLRDVVKAGPGGPITIPKAFVAGLNLMNKWTDGTVPAEWGEDTIFVLDSFSADGRAAFNWAKGMNPSAKDPRQWFFQAQQALEDTVAMLTSEAFHANVIIISHVNYKEVTEGVTKGHVNAIGSALGPIIPRYFNTLVLAESSGSGKNVRRRIKTVPTSTIDLKNAAPFKLDADLPLETGMATIFSTLKGQ